MEYKYSGWDVIDEFDEGDFNVALLQSIGDGSYSIAIADDEDEIWLDMYDSESAIHIFNHLQKSSRRIWNGAT